MQKILGLACVLPLVVTGCAVSSQQDVAATPARVQNLVLSGVVHGGQQPVSGSTVTLYAAGTGSDGSLATALVSTTTGSSGTFTFPAYTYTCSSQQLYVVATGGNPGLTPSVNNGNLSLVTALGACSSINSSTNIAINELTTVAAAWALANYATSYSHIGSMTSDATAMASAFTLAGELVSTSAGTVPGSTIPNGYTSPSSEIYTLGDILATCVNSAGSAGTNCGTLFTDTTPYQGTAATDTFGAALLLAKNPNQNVTTAFGLASGTGPFQPILSAAPADWTVPLLPSNAIRILFVGDSFTHGRYSPVRNYNSSNVTDENYDVASNSSRAETSAEPGPYGGIPGIFKELTVEGGVNYDVHIEAISSTSLANNYSDAQSVVANPQWNAVVLQELSYLPLPPTQSPPQTGDPQTFCNAVKTVEQGIHTANSSASVYLYETWARADETEQYATSSSVSFASAQSTLTTSYHNVYYQAAASDGNIAGVAPAGDAWLSEINTTNSYMMQNPYGYPYAGGVSPFLWFLYVPGSSPATTDTMSDPPDYLHPSIYGAYLNALVLYEEITGQNSTLLGSGEAAAAALGISPTIAAQLQSVAHAQVLTGVGTGYGTGTCSVT